MLALLTLRVAIEVVDKVRDGVVERSGGDAVVVLAVVHKLQALSLIHSYEDVIVEELPLVVQKRKNTLGGMKMCSGCRVLSLCTRHTSKVTANMMLTVQFCFVYSSVKSDQCYVLHVIFMPRNVNLQHIISLCSCKLS